MPQVTKRTKTVTLTFWRVTYGQMTVRVHPQRDGFFCPTCKSSNCVHVKAVIEFEAVSIVSDMPKMQQLEPGAPDCKECGKPCRRNRYGEYVCGWRSCFAFGT